MIKRYNYPQYTKQKKRSNGFMNFLKTVFFFFICTTLTSSFDPIEYRPCVYEFPPEIEEIAITEDILALQERIDNIFESYKDHKFRYGIKVIALDKNQTIYEANHEESFIPASNLKVLTTAAAYHFLSPDFRWQTNFYINFDGNLYIRPSGDPTWNDKYYGIRLNHLFNAIADSLAQFPNIRVNNIILEKGTFHDYKMEYFWRPNNRIQAYSARPSQFAFFNNTVQLKIEPTALGQKADITLFPVNAGFEITNNVYTTGNRNTQPIRVVTDSLSNQITVSGSVFRNSRPQFRSVSTPLPEEYVLTVFKEKFDELEIPYEGEIYYESISEREFRRSKFERLFYISSVSLTEVASDINKWSNNFTSNQLFLTIGETERHVWQTENIIKEWLISSNIPVHDLKIFDGSGLSHFNKVSPDLMVHVLKFAYNASYFEEFFSTLPISGTDGTLRRHLNSPTLKGEVFAKTGYVMGARGLTGYVRTADGELFAFSFLMNRPNSSLNYFYEVAEQVLTEIALFKRVDYTFSEEEEEKTLFGIRNWLSR